MKILVNRLLIAAACGFFLVQGCQKHSPNLDRLAAEGCLFTHHFATVPTCGASRCCLLTGELPRTQEDLSNEAVRLRLSGKPEGEKPETFIHHLRRNGYRTVGIGKISHYADGLLYGYGEPVGTQKELPHSWDELAFDPGKWRTGWNAFFAYADGSNRQSRNRQVKPYEAADVLDSGYPDGLTAQLALSKLRDLKEEGQPFFLGVGFFKPHLPFNAPGRYWDLYDEDSIPLSPSNFIPGNIDPAGLHNSGELNQYALGEEKASLEGPVSDAYARKLRRAYFACVSYIDAQIGTLLTEVKHLGLDKNTIIVVWGDHGWHLGDHLVWGKHTVFERALRSVLIIKAPGRGGAGVKRDEIVSTVDIYPTLMELCGLPMPHRTDGKSFASLLHNAGNPRWESRAFGYYRRGITLRTDRYRLTRYFRPQEPKIELYDHVTDPNENQNTAEENPEVVKRLMGSWHRGDTGLFK
jgi:arylsulfatase A-like enzyme